MTGLGPIWTCRCASTCSVDRPLEAASARRAGLHRGERESGEVGLAGVFGAVWACILGELPSRVDFAFEPAQERRSCWRGVRAGVRDAGVQGVWGVRGERSA